MTSTEEVKSRRAAIENPTSRHRSIHGSIDTEDDYDRDGAVAIGDFIAIAQRVSRAGQVCRRMRRIVPRAPGPSSELGAAITPRFQPRVVAPLRGTRFPGKV